MAQNMRDALNLAWKLERVLRHGESDHLLDTYQQERKPHVVTTTRTAMALGREICECDSGLAAQRDARLLTEQGGAVQTVLRQDLIPGLTSGLIDLDSPAAGSILPQPFVHAAGFAGRLDDLTGGVVRAIAVEPLSAAERASLVDALTPFGGVLVVLGTSGGRAGTVVDATEDEGVMKSWLRATGRSIAIARPDHYVYGTASSAAEAVELLTGLRARLGGLSVTPAHAHGA